MRSHAMTQRRRFCRFMAFDRHLNLVLGDSEEFRRLPPKKGKSEEEVSDLADRRLALSLFPCFISAEGGAEGPRPGRPQGRGDSILDH